MQRLTTKYFIDLIVWVLATPLAFFIRLEAPWLSFWNDMLVLAAVGIPAKAVAVFAFGFFRRAWRKFGVHDLLVLLAGVAAVCGYLWMMRAVFLDGFLIPRSVPLIEGMLVLLLLSGIRLAVRMADEKQRRTAHGGRRVAKRVLVVGAGEAGSMMAREMQRHPEARRTPVGFLDDDPLKRRLRIMGLPVLGAIRDLESVVQRKAIDEVLIAMPSEGGQVVRRVVERAQQAGVDYRTVPGIYQLLSGNVEVSQIREVDVEDLLRRPPVRLEMEQIRHILADQTVLVTGAGGSIGSEIVRQVAQFSPRRVLLLGRGENSIYGIEQEVRRSFPKLEFIPVITDVRDYDSLERVFAAHRPGVVFHAAAHKHVPLMEANPEQAIFNNVVGTQNVVDLALAYKVGRLVNISTDKAVNPTSVMGASKRVAELLVSRAAKLCSGNCAYVSVRFGNVLGSRGSVVPLFKQQIRRGGPITITHPDMERYFMTIPEASQLVLQAASMAENGNVYVLDMGEPVKIQQLAEDLIHLSGLEPYDDIDIVYSGIRPGEKLFEELLTSDEGTVASRHEKIHVARNGHGVCDDTFSVDVQRLIAAADERDHAAIYETLRAIIPTHQLGQDIETPEMATN